MGGSFLYTGADPLQTGVDPADVDVRAAALLEGYVYEPHGAPASYHAVTGCCTTPSSASRTPTCTAATRRATSSITSSAIRWG